MHRHRTLIALLLLSLPLSACTFNAKAFHKDVVATSAVYEDFLLTDTAKTLALDGKLDELNQSLLKLVPDSKKTALDHFTLGNLFYRIDDALSLSQMEQAYSALPGNPAVLLELGMLKHRQGNCAAATSYYEKFHRSRPGKQHAPSWAFATDCYLRTGHYQKAVAAWEKADFKKNHIGIEEAFYEIYGDPKPDVKRQDILRRINSGQQSLLCELIRLDKNWEINWWNKTVKEDYFEHDLKLVDELLATDNSARIRYNSCVTPEKYSDAEFLARLEKTGIWGTTKSLPDSAELSRVVIKRLMEMRKANAQELLEAFEVPLQKRIKEEADDTGFLNLLAYLYSQQQLKEKLQKLDLYGWRELHLEDYASSYIANLDPMSENYSALLEEALHDFPQNTLLNKTYLRIHADDALRLDAAARFVASRFAHAAYDDNGFRLGDYMASFAKEMAATDTHGQK